MSAQQKSDVGMRVAFWSWMVIIASGLVVMLVLPLTGR